MEGKKLRISLDSMPPYIDYVEENGRVFLKGVWGELWETLEEDLRFRCEYLRENYTTGIENFRNGTRDVLLHPVVVSANSRNELVLPVTNVWYNVYFRRSPQINSSKAFIRTWSIELWVSTIFLICASIVLLYSAHLLSEKYFTTDLKTDNWSKRFCQPYHKKRTQETSFGNCFMAVLAAMFSQDICLQSKVISIRILLFVVLSFSLIVNTAYSGLLISQLTLGAEFIPFTNLDELLRMNRRYSLCVRPGNYPSYQLTHDKDNRGRWGSILNKKPCPEYENIDPTKLCQNNVAYLEIPALIERHFGNVKCQMTKLPRRYYQVSASLLMSRKSLNLETENRIREEMTKFREIGIITKLEKTWLMTRNKACGWDGNHVQISYEHVSGVILVYFLSIGFSCLIFLIELLSTYN